MRTTGSKGWRPNSPKRCPQLTLIDACFVAARKLPTALNVSGKWPDAYSATAWLRDRRDEGALPANFTQGSEFMLLQEPGLLSQGFNVGPLSSQPTQTHTAVSPDRTHHRESRGALE